MREPIEPGYSWPHLDSAIQEIEAARKIHDQLRNWGLWWQNRAEEIEKDLSNENDELHHDIKKLEARIEELEDEIRYHERQKQEVLP